jgi:hypothetical protein
VVRGGGEGVLHGGGRGGWKEGRRIHGSRGGLFLDGDKAMGI